MIKNRQVKGTNFNQESFNSINLEQIGLQKNLHELIKKFFTLSKQWDKDIDRDDKRIFQNTIKEHFIQLKMEMLEGNQMGSNNTFFQETVTQKLKKELIRNTQFPDTVINILQNDLEDKEKQKMIEQAKMAKQYNKINQKKLTLIRKEFMTAHGRERQIKVLDAMLGHVKFLAKYSEE